jgi:hypothetical protein
MAAERVSMVPALRPNYVIQSGRSRPCTTCTEDMGSDGATIGRVDATYHAGGRTVRDIATVAALCPACIGRLMAAASGES